MIEFFFIFLLVMPKYGVKQNFTLKWVERRKNTEVPWTKREEERKSVVTMVSTIY